MPFKWRESIKRECPTLSARFPAGPPHHETSALGWAIRHPLARRMRMASEGHIEKSQSEKMPIRSSFREQVVPAVPEKRQFLVIAKNLDFLSKSTRANRKWPFSGDTGDNHAMHRSLGAGPARGRAVYAPRPLDPDVYESHSFVTPKLCNLFDICYLCTDFVTAQ